jgi:hypothetical protein
MGAAYTWRDASVSPGPTYYYWLEGVDIYGTAPEHGPVSASVIWAPTHLIHLPVIQK